MNLPIETRRKKLAAKITVGIIAAAILGVVGPFLLMGAVTGVALLIAFGIGAGLIGAAPVIAFKFANWRLKEVKAEATKNPIETLQGLQQAKREALTAFRHQLESFVGTVNSFEAEVGDFKKKYPDRAQFYQKKLDGMRALQKHREGLYKQAQGEFKTFCDTVEAAEADYKMAMRALALDQAAGMDTGDVFAKIKEDIALDSVQDSMSRAFAQLEVALLDSEDARVEKDITPRTLTLDEREASRIDLKQTLEIARATRT